MTSVETLSDNSLSTESLATLSDAQLEHISLESILRNLDFSVEKQYPSPESIRLLEESSIFLFDKICMLLAALGEKPASLTAFHLDSWKDGEEEKKVSEEQTLEICTVAEQLGLKTGIMDTPVKWSTEDNAKIRTVGVSLSESNLELLMRTHREYSIASELLLGKVLGFPDTSVIAYATQEGMVPVDQLNLEGDKAFTSFRLSEKDEIAEMETVYRWADAVAKASPLLYREYVNTRRL